MAESSLFWTTNGTGDGSGSGYTAAQMFDLWRALFTPQTGNLGGVSPDYQSKLAASGTTSPVTIAAGAAIVYGIPYFNTANVTVAIPTPSGATRIDRIVLRASWAAQTVRITRIAGTEGGAAPALTQSAGTTWDIPLAQASITTAGAITLTDQREYLSLVGNDAITSAKIAAGAVGTTDIADGAITSAKIATDAVGAAAIAAGAVGSSELATGAVTAGKIATGGVSASAQLAAGVVNAPAILDTAVTVAKIADGAVTEAKLGTGAVTEAKLGTGAVTEAKLGTGAVTSDKIAASAVSASKILDGQVTSAKLVTGAVTSAKIAAGAVDGTKIAAGAVGTSALANGAVTADKLASNSVTSAKIAAGAVDSAKIAAGAVGTSALADGAVTGGKIPPNSINIDRIGTGVPMITGRRGGLDASWSSRGTTPYSTNVACAMEVGAFEAVVSYSTLGQLTVYFSDTFGRPPLVVATPVHLGGSYPEITVHIDTVTDTYFTFWYRSLSVDGTTKVGMHWIAIGEEA
ncbi:MAG: hypothetical protein NAOJABEB_03151 [Steroidobacteraceae bacterium]|nr:hypothetical protein [Steroidobacteraceae bacterium]